MTLESAPQPVTMAITWVALDTHQGRRAIGQVGKPARFVRLTGNDFIVVPIPQRLPVIGETVLPSNVGRDP